jgi:hypothetical protein
MPTPELTPTPIREFLENNGDRISEAIRRAARLGAGGHEPVGVEAELLVEQASSAVIEAISGVIDSRGDTLHLGVAGNVTVVAELVPEGPRSRGQVLLRAGRMLHLTSLPMPTHGERGYEPNQQVQDATVALGQRQGAASMEVATADAEGHVKVLGATPGEEYSVVRAPHGELLLVPLSAAEDGKHCQAKVPRAGADDDIHAEVAEYYRRWRSHIEEMSDRIATHLEDEEASPEEHELLRGRIEVALIRALEDAFVRRHEIGYSYGIELDVVIAIPRPLDDRNSIMIKAARLVCRGDWIPSPDDRVSVPKRRGRQRT